MKLAILLPVFALSFACVLSSCSSLSKIPVPFVGEKSESGESPVVDQDVPYQIQQSLGSGHTLKFTVYTGQRNPKKLYSGSAVVNSEGFIRLKKHGDIKVGGLKAGEAIKLIGSHFRREYGHLVINVQLEEIEGTELLFVEGAVNSPGVIPWFEDATSLNVLKYVGGRHATATGEAIYITRDGVRRFYPSAATDEGGHVLKAGDIIHYSSDL